MIYLIIIIVGMILVAGINIACGSFGCPWYYSLIATIGYTIAVVALDGLTAWIIRRMPAQWFDKDRRIFNVSKKEISFYDKIGIKSWKDKVPELGGFTSFHKDKVEDPHNNEYLERFLLEACYGMVIHIVSCPVSFLIVFLDWHMFAGSSVLFGLSIGLPVAFVNAILILLPAFILRYNIPRLKILYKFNLRKKK